MWKSMTRKRYQEDNTDFRNNHDRWLISYADFITLMFAFFVVLYAMNTIKANKDNTTQTPASFKSQTSPTPNALPCLNNQVSISNNPLISADNQLLTSLLPAQTPIQFNLLNESSETISPSPSDSKKINLDKQNSQISAIATQLQQRLQEMINKGKVQILQSNWGISIDINASILFGSADADLNQDARQTLNTISSILKAEAYPIRIEGYTDNKPIKNRNFPSNWELSSARASGVVRYFIQQGIASERLAALGYAENNPIADNNSEVGRARNRRVLLKILADDIDQASNDIKSLKHNLN
jgi:chemotaxis protein MotB